MVTCHNAHHFYGVFHVWKSTKSLLYSKGEGGPARGGISIGNKKLARVRICRMGRTWDENLNNMSQS